MKRACFWRFLLNNCVPTNETNKPLNAISARSAVCFLQPILQLRKKSLRPTLRLRFLYCICTLWMYNNTARSIEAEQRLCSEQGCGSGSWKRSFFCGRGSAKILPLPLPHRLFDLESNLAKNFCAFPNVD